MKQHLRNGQECKTGHVKGRVTVGEQVNVESKGG
jgi:hypothetical protein